MIVLGSYKQFSFQKIASLTSVTKQWLKTFYINNLLSTMIFSIIVQQSPSLALMENQIDQLIKLINLVTIILVCQKENFLSFHIHSISPSLYHVSLFCWYKLILWISHPDFSFLLLPLSYCFLSSFPLYVWSSISTISPSNPLLLLFIPLC